MGAQPSGGRENLEAVSFFQELNTLIGARGRGAVTIAEESTAWPGVTSPVHHGGLGFHFKWNMGWMHDTLRFFARNPIHRGHHGDDVTFGLIYAFSENFVLPISHDEVVHGKGLAALAHARRRLAALRKPAALPRADVDASGQETALHGLRVRRRARMVGRCALPLAASRRRASTGCLEGWCAISTRSIARPLPCTGSTMPPRVLPGSSAMTAPTRSSPSAASAGRAAPTVLVVANMTPVPRHDYRIGVSKAGLWHERLNSDAGAYGGAGLGNGGERHTDAVAAHGQAQSLSLTLPPLGLLVLEHDAAAR
jgi:1,4-alpha-glucan branching enzyme